MNTNEKNIHAQQSCTNLFMIRYVNANVNTYLYIYEYIDTHIDIDIETDICISIPNEKNIYTHSRAV